MPAGWYPDPFSSAAYLRWWDGTRWTARTQLPSEHQQPVPGVPAASGTPPVYGAPNPPPYPSEQYGRPYASGPPAPGRYPQGPYAQGQYATFALASWGLRFVAFLIDVVIISVILTPLYVALLWPAFSNLFAAIPADGSTLPPSAMLAFQEQVLGVSLLLSVMYAVVSFVYFVPQNVRYGRTLGKRAAGIRIRMLAEDRPPGWRAATIRWAVLTVGTLVASGIFALIDCLWPLWDKPWQQALHDKAAGTVVVPGSGH